MTSSTPPNNDNPPKKRRLPHIPPRKETVETDVTSNNVSKHIVKRIQKGSVKLPNGTTYDLTIPAPTAEDIEWAEGCFEADQEERNKAASLAITEGSLWRLQFLLAMNKKQDNFIDINAFGQEDNDLTLLAHTALTEDNGADFAALLLSYGANIEKGGNPRWANHRNARDNTPMRAAIKNNSVEVVALLLDNEAQFYKDDFDEAKHVEIQEYLVKRFDVLGEVSQYSNLNAPQKRDSKWERIDDFSVAKISHLPGRMRLTKTFNFLAQEIDKVVEVLDAEGATTHPPSHETQQFDDVTHKGEIKQAHEKLLSLNGTPDDLKTYMGGKTKRGNSPKNS